MTDHWDFYKLRVDDQPASIFVDLGLEANAPLQALPYMAYVRLRMNRPSANGLSSQEEFETLKRIERALEAELSGNDARYVGRNTSSGCRDFYFYLARPQLWDQNVAGVLSSFSDYEFQTGTRDDPAWEVYSNFLLPGPVGRQIIRNRRVCEALESRGDPLVKPREIDHWSYFPDQACAEAYLADAIALGFQLRCRSEDGDGPRSHGVQVWRVDTPSFAEIDDVNLPLLEVAQCHRGAYDGWECSVESIALHEAPQATG